MSAVEQPRFLLRSVLAAIGRAHADVEQALTDLADPEYVVDLGDRDLPVKLNGERYRVHNWKHLPDDPNVYMTLRPEGEE